MERGERFYKIHNALKSGRCLPLSHFTGDLGISRATFKRDIEYLRDRYGAPLVWDAERRGYRYEQPASAAEKFELPGLWLSGAEIHALLAMQAMLADLDEGVLAGQVEPVMKRIEALLEEGRVPRAAVRRRIRILHQSARASEPECFARVAQAVLQRKRLDIRYFNRATGERSERQLSPQRLVHYRDNWYADAWCHLRQDVRTFALDAIERAALADEKAREVPEAELDRILGASYGIFSGAPAASAKLRFSAPRSRWVAKERWHPGQQGAFDAQGRWVLEIPYSDDRELLMDILRHGADVEVLGPPALRERVHKALLAAEKQYANK